MRQRWNVAVTSRSAELSWGNCVRVVARDTERFPRGRRPGFWNGLVCDHGIVVVNILQHSVARYEGTRWLRLVGHTHALREVQGEPLQACVLTGRQTRNRDFDFGFVGA